MSAWGKANGVKDEIVCAFFRPFHLTAFALWELPSRNKPAERGSIQYEANFEYQLFLNDTETAFSSRLGWTAGGRTSRYALIIDHGKIVYAEKEPGREVTVSGAEAVLAKL